MLEARELAKLAAERAFGSPDFGDFGDSGIFDEPGARASSPHPHSFGATAAGHAVPVERGAQAYEDFASEGVGEILRAATDLKDLAETPLSQLYG